MGWTITLSIVAAAALITSLAGGFGTGTLPIGMRLFVFAATIGVNAVKWGLWTHLLGRVLPSGLVPWLAGGVAGALLLNLSLPLELELAFAALGLEQELPYWPIYLTAVIISLVIFGVVATIGGSAPATKNDTVAHSASPMPAVPAFLAAAGVHRPGDLLAIVAEDHYIRLHHASGKTLLILHRFGDAVDRLGDWDGLQVHRGVWVARHAVQGTSRSGRRWQLRLGDGSVVPVSASFVPQVRAAGLLSADAAR